MITSERPAAAKASFMVPRKPLFDGCSSTTTGCAGALAAKISASTVERPAVRALVVDHQQRDVGRGVAEERLVAAHHVVVGVEDRDHHDRLAVVGQQAAGLVRGVGLVQTHSSSLDGSAGQLEQPQSISMVGLRASTPASLAVFLIWNDTARSIR